MSKLASDSLVLCHELNELVDDGRPSTIVLKVREVTTRLLVEIPEELPSIFRDDTNLISFHLVCAEGLPLLKEAAG